MKKQLTAMLLAGMLAVSMAGTAAATGSQALPVKDYPPLAAEATTRAEETEWHYRILNGKWQMRLWSITENMWLTDWIDC